MGPGSTWQSRTISVGLGPTKRKILTPRKVKPRCYGKCHYAHALEGTTHSVDVFERQGGTGARKMGTYPRACFLGSTTQLKYYTTIML